MYIGKHFFDIKNHTYVMGILNVTPDSFSDGGNYDTLDKARFQAESMVAKGVHIIDVGGESTRPGHQQISVAEEIDRVAPVIEVLAREFDLPISVDTYKSAVAQVAIDAGATMVNDIWGLQYDDAMAKLLSEKEVAVCLMHNRKEAVYQDFLPDVINDLQKSVSKALAAGIKSERIVLDPGVGFAKSYEQNLIVLKQLQQFVNLGYPLLLGASRKSVVGLTLDLPKDQREEGTLVTTVGAVMAGYGFVRVHDVEKNIQAIKMAEAIRQAS